MNYSHDMRWRPTIVWMTAAVALGACSGGSSRVARGTCPAAPVRVVVSVSPWSDLVRALADDCGTVRTVVTGAAGDPHDYEPTPADATAIGRADLVVVNGLGYDAWATSVAGAGGGRVVDLGRATNQAADADPHLWYDPSVLDRAADAVTGALRRTRPGAAAFFAERRRAWTSSLAEYRAALDTAQRSLEGRNYAATEPVMSRLARVLRMVDRTPDGFVRAAGNETEPPPSDVAAFDALLRRGDVVVLVVNAQTTGPVADALRATAERGGVPVVEVRETPPPNTSWIDWQVAQLDALAKAAR